MKISLEINLEDAQIVALQRHIDRQLTTEAGDGPGVTVSRPMYPGGIAQFLQEQFYSSVAHLLPQAISGQAEALQKQADDLMKQAREARMSMLVVSAEDK